jgi:hypothetical protein
MNEEVFYRNSESNSFDNLLVNVAKVYEAFPINKMDRTNPESTHFFESPFHKIYRYRFLPLQYRRFFWRVARQINLDLSWFQEFRLYWTSVLGGRPLSAVYDLFFLKSLYRIKFGKNQIPDTNDTGVHLTAWQHPDVVLYQLLHFVTKESVVDQLNILKQLFKFKKNARILLEFGCATAPITTSLLEFYQPKKDLQAYVSDIATLAFHYASHKLRHNMNVHPILLLPENDFLPVLKDHVDVVFCMAVFEHLNKPLGVARFFYEALNSGGLFFFDYIKSDGQGMDTLHGVRERDDVLDFVSGHFDILQGALSKDKSVGLTIARKR